jgi:hypothetical protein
MTSHPPARPPDQPWFGGRSLHDEPTVVLRPVTPRRRPFRTLPPGGEPPPERGGWRAVLSAASLVTVALVPGAVMAAGAISVASNAVCGFGSFCLYSGPDFTGDRVEYTADELFCQGKRPGLEVRTVLPAGVGSVYNNTGTAGDGLTVKIYGKLGRVTLPTVLPGHEVRTVDAQAASDMHTLCVYPRAAAPAR